MSKLKMHLLIAMSLFSFTIPSIGLACHWVITGEFSREIECRSNYNNFFKVRGNSGAYNKLLKDAAFLALGEAQKITADNWEIRNAISTKDGAELLEKRFEAEELLTAINQQSRQWAAMNGQFEAFLPEALMVGVTTPVDVDFTKLGFLPSWLKVLGSQGGSVFVGYVIIPQKVEFVMQQDQLIYAPEYYANVDEKENDDEFLQDLSEIVHLGTPEQTGISGLFGRLRFEARLVVIPSFDLPVRLKPGEKSKNTEKLLTPTFGIAMGRNVITSHQLLTSGASISVPGSLWPSIKNLTPHTKALFGNKLGRAIYKYVDTIKVGRSLFTQSSDSEASRKDTVTFNDNTYVWFRMANRATRAERQAVINQAQGIQANPVGQNAALANTELPTAVAPQSVVTQVKELAAKVVDGQVRISGFTVIGVKNDGESDSMVNGIASGDFQLIAGGLIDTLKTALLTSGVPLTDEMSPEQQLVALRKSLELNEDAPKSQKLSIEQELEIRRAIEILEKEVDGEDDKSEAKPKFDTKADDKKEK